MKVEVSDKLLRMAIWARNSLILLKSQAHLTSKISREILKRGKVMVTQAPMEVLTVALAVLMVAQADHTVGLVVLVPLETVHTAHITIGV